MADSSIMTISGTFATREQATRLESSNLCGIQAILSGTHDLPTG